MIEWCTSSFCSPKAVREQLQRRTSLFAATLSPVQRAAARDLLGPAQQPVGDAAVVLLLKRLADAEPLGRALPRPRRENPGELTVGAAVTVNGATGTIKCVRPNGRVDVDLAAGDKGPAVG